VNFPTLDVDLSAVTRNYQLLASRHTQKRCASVVKANAYGLGVAHVAPALHAAGCRDFFVATLEEGIELREIVASCELQVAGIFVFHGVRKGEAKEFAAHNLIPVLNTLEQWNAWNTQAPCALHIDTGMCRLGIAPQEAFALQPATRNLQLVLSHLACANEPSHHKNREQLAVFNTVRQHFAGIPASLANSSGIFLGTEYHGDLLRPGCSLYGISPNTMLANPVENVVTLSAPVLQIRTLEQAQTVGYGGTYHAKAGAVLATVELGYADGFHRRLSGTAYGYAHGMKLPVVGRVSMDMVSVDISALPAHLRTPDLRISFIGKEQPVDVLAEAAGTIGYEIFTRLGQRVKRVYKDFNPRHTAA
jgi:alanine racemase